ncbi:glycosyltransferase family 25 protein [Halomonas vilamensis]|uniref:Glycosyltransferase family 25 protein n=1 Tax=Vreelandella vilamensis TaxID=531309 RepID=A0ABU1H3N8_9GAMM|nr:glycosyltransferase family 25 protein [Halomonas vilamensis]MDR5898921.1 glycosyltransferase family 25 protein [Halomonas vilamensis]
MELPEIIVISLKRATERRRSIEMQFSELKLPFNFFDAIDGKQGHELFTRYDTDRARQIGEIPLTSGHLGCYTSHFLVWQHCVELEKPMIILEDDAMIFPGPFLSFVEQASSLPQEFECVRLFKSKSRNQTSWLLFEQGDLSIAKFLRGHKSATGYYLTPSAARKFLKYGERWMEPVDIEMDQFWANGVECYGVLIPCLTHNPDFESAIDMGIDTSQARRGLMRLRWRWYLLKGKIAREFHNFMFKAKMQR